MATVMEVVVEGIAMEVEVVKRDMLTQKRIPKISMLKLLSFM